MAGRIRKGIQAGNRAQGIYGATKRRKPGNGHSVNRKKDAAKMCADRLSALLGEMETPGARDTVRMALAFAESSVVATAEENAAFMTGLAQILSGLDSDAKSSRGRE